MTAQFRRPGATATAALILLMTGACGHGASTSSAKPTAAQIGFAEAIARHQNGRDRASVNGGALYVSRGVVPESESNVGAVCNSGTLLNIVLNGSFPGDITSDGQGVRELVITADGMTGAMCVLAVRTTDTHFTADWTQFSTS